MNLFFSIIIHLVRTLLAIIVLCLAPYGGALSQELSPATKKLFEAIDKGDLGQVKSSIANGADYRAVNYLGITPVDLAVDKGHVKIMHYLLHVVESQRLKTKLPLPTTSKFNTPKNPKTELAEPFPSFNNELSTVVEVYSPPPDAGPWSATVVTAEPPSNMQKAEETDIREKNKSALKKIARSFPLRNPIPALTNKSTEKPKFIDSKNTVKKEIKKGTSLREKDLPAKSLTKSLSKKSFERLVRNKPKSVIYKIGRATVLNKAPLSMASTDTFYQSCIIKKSGTLIFCIENLNWPDKIRTFFSTDSNLPKNTHTIVRYDRGAATYFHTLFPSKSYNQIINFFTQRYGTPTKTLERSIAPLAKKRRVNPTVMWQSISPATKLLTTLEVRMYDDNRGGFPDTKRGAIYLYNEKSQTIFPHVSLVELMLLRAKSKL